jgi:hypothetical protein
VRSRVRGCVRDVVRLAQADDVVDLERAKRAPGIRPPRALLAHTCRRRSAALDRRDQARALRSPLAGVNHGASRRDGCSGDAVQMARTSAATDR